MNKFLFYLTLAVFFPSISLSFAQTTQLQITPNGKSREIQVPVGYTSNKVILYFLSKGNITQLADIGVSGPNGLRIKGSYRIPSGALDQLLTSDKGWNDLPFQDTAGKQSAFISIKKDTATTDSSSTNSSGTTSSSTDTSTCGGLKEVDIQFFIQQGVFGSTRADVCKFFSAFGNIVPPEVGGTPTSGNPFIPGGSGNDLDRSFLIRKDTCGTKKDAQYLVRFEVLLDQIDQASKDAGFKFSIAAKAENYKGRMAASIKPISDGKFFPAPLILIHSLGGYFEKEEKVSVVRWKNRRISSVKQLPVDGEFVNYRGKFLRRVVASSVMTGGKATVEISNNNDAYSVCFDMVRKRQRVNGYVN
jgi:hypothetical protein